MKIRRQLQTAFQDKRLRWIAGLFYQRQEHRFDLRYTVDEVDPAKSLVEGGGVIWQTDQKRVDIDFAIFGEAYFDITDNWTLIGGVREFKWDNSLYGFNGQIRFCTGYYDENGDFVQATADEGGVPQYPCYNTGILDDVSTGWDTAWKGSTEYRIDDDKMVYATYSQGFRAGGVNRARVEGIPKYQPDWVYNYEVGWKTTWADDRFRFNGALYIEDWEDFQFGFLDFEAYGPLTVIQNVGNARTKGVEWQMEWAPTDSFSLSFQGSYNNAELRDDFWRVAREETGYVDEDGEFVEPLPPNAPAGTEMPYVPPLQMTSIGRYNFTMGELASFAQVAVSYRLQPGPRLIPETIARIQIMAAKCQPTPC
jgi:outer membrane receptor protein involved in Fe transport